MQVLTAAGEEILDLQKWEKAFFSSRQKKKHWKTGRSAKSLAEFILAGDGATSIEELLSAVLSEDVALETAYPEMEVQFDSYGAGREHDLGIYGRTDSGRKVFVGLEAKVDESFGAPVSEVYLEAKSREIARERTNAPKRIENLLRQNFSTISADLFKLRYQLLYATAGTVFEKKGADLHVLLILVFRTDKYDEQQGKDNNQDYMAFMRKADAESQPSPDGATTVHRLTIEGKELISLYTHRDWPSPPINPPGS